MKLKEDNGLISGLTELIKSGATTATDIAHATFHAIANCADTAIFTSVTPERAFREAEASSKRILEGRSLGVLDGIPVAWKDLYDLKGMVTRAGSRILDQGPALVDAALVRRLTDAGAVTVGKLNMTEFAFSGLGLNPHYGTPRNPWDRKEPRIPGGSSSGCGVAVALGLVSAAIGTDTSGSVRIPAALNGIIGFKTSSGRWPLNGCYPLSRTLDTAGVLTQTVVDAAVIDAAARGLAIAERPRRTVRGIRLVVPTNAVWDGVEPAVLSNFESAIGRLSDEGAVIERRRLPVLDDVLSLGARYGTLVAIEAYELHGHRLLTTAANLMDRRVKSRLVEGGSISTESAAALRTSRGCLIESLAALFDGNTFVAFPTVPIVAPLLVLLENDDEAFAATNALMLRNTMIGSFLNWCGVAIPSGFDATGLPTSVLFSGGPDDDSQLLLATIAMEPLVRSSSYH
ncbi:amidase family protein [Pseudomonas sp. Root569]|uniref:amidase family protein n=1 Tax=Pseudomonas sp. Root569 TaxID=1736566 RepID=UPI000702A236|nr:amidase family protein [Pseudomonas sp. Root569]KRA22732.1 hypothetical protein ASD70_20685 [Pseudomonas sp. Root569]